MSEGRRPPPGPRHTPNVANRVPQDARKESTDGRIATLPSRERIGCPPVPALPPLATSSIGSLPHTQLELALQQALLLDIPAAPQLPRRDPVEYMVPQALEGLHGLRADAEGNADLDLGDWRRGAATLDARLDQ